MTAKEQRISETIARLLPTLSEGQKDCFLAYAEGMAAALDTIKPPDHLSPGEKRSEPGKWKKS